MESIVYRWTFLKFLWGKQQDTKKESHSVSSRDGSSWLKYTERGTE
jgi:hypothetical protein